MANNSISGTQYPIDWAPGQNGGQVDYLGGSQGFNERGPMYQPNPTPGGGPFGAMPTPTPMQSNPYGSGGVQGVSGGTNPWAPSAPSGPSVAGGYTGPSLGSGAYVPGAGVPGQGTVFGAGGATGNPQGNQLMDTLTAMAQGQTGAYESPYIMGAQDPNDPIIKAQVDAYRTEQQNEFNNYRTNLAETAGPNAPIGAQTEAAQEAMGQNVAGFQAQVMQQQLTARQQQIQQALSGATGFLSTEQSQQLQEELAQLQLAQNAFATDTANANQVGLA